MADFLEQYGVGDERRGKIIKRVVISLASLLALAWAMPVICAFRVSLIARPAASSAALLIRMPELKRSSDLVSAPL